MRTRTINSLSCVAKLEDKNYMLKDKVERLTCKNEILQEDHDELLCSHEKLIDSHLMLEIARGCGNSGKIIPTSHPQVHMYTSSMYLIMC